MTTRPMYILAAVVLGGVRIKHFRSDGPESPSRVLEDPPTFRWAGFDLRTLDSAKQVDDTTLEVRSGDRKVLRLTQESLFTARLAADNEFLGWGKFADDFERHPYLNPVACVEVHAAFCHLYSKLLSFAEKEPTQIRLHAALRNAKLATGYLCLTSFYQGPGIVIEPERFPAHNNDVDADFTVTGRELLEHPNRVAYRLLASFASFFDLPESKLPFVRKTEAGLEIDTDALTRL